MSATTDSAGEVGRYLDEVRAALADLPPEERDELLDDLPDHLALVLAEQAGSLVERLGPPERYAMELRAAAGVAVPAPPPGRVTGIEHRLRRRLDRMRPYLDRADVRIGPLFGYQTARDLLRVLRPGWWVLRGFLFGLLVLRAVNVLDAGSWLPGSPASLLLWLLVAGGCVLGSVRLGQATQAPRRRTRLALAGGTLLLLFLALANFGTSRGDSGPSVYYSPYDRVRDIYPYDGDGRPLTGVRLYDEDGNPIHLGDPWRCPRQLSDVSRFDDPYDGGYPLCVPGATIPPAADLARSPGPGPSTPGPDASASGTPAPTGQASGSPAPAGSVPAGQASGGPASGSSPAPPAG